MENGKGFRAPTFDELVSMIRECCRDSDLVGVYASTPDVVRAIKIVKKERAAIRK